MDLPAGERSVRPLGESPHCHPVIRRHIPADHGSDEQRAEIP
jgi:hypothetical protein